jgi:hypothetical protein
MTRRQRVAVVATGRYETEPGEQAQVDFQDFAIIGDADAALEDGVLVLRIDLRPPDARA